MTDTYDEVEETSNTSSNIDSEVKAKLDDFDEKFNWSSWNSQKLFSNSFYSVHTKSIILL